MFCIALVALLAVSANAYMPEMILGKWPHDTYTVKKICEIIKMNKYGTYDTLYEPTLYNDVEDMETFGFLGQVKKFGSRKQLREMDYCCNKFSWIEKKNCLKDVTENYIDKYCDRGLNHICCKSEFENRYSCFAKNPLRRTWTTNPIEEMEEMRNPMMTMGGMMNPWRRREMLVADEIMNEERVRDLVMDEDRYTSWENIDEIRRGFPTTAEKVLYNIEKDIVDERLGGRKWIRGDIEDIDTLDTVERALGYEDVMMTPRYGKYWPLKTMETEMELEGELMGEDIMGLDTIFERPCYNSMHCQRKLERATNVAAEDVCINKMFKPAHHQTKQCCRAGAMVGKIAGRKNRHVCVPALLKFQAKTHQCLHPFNKHQCKQAFVECCHENAEWSREERGIEKELVRDTILREEIEDPTMMMYEKRMMMPFY